MDDKVDNPKPKRKRRKTVIIYQPRRLSVMVPAELLLGARKAAHLNSTTVSRLVRQFLEDYIIATGAIARNEIPKRKTAHTLTEMVNVVAGVSRRSYEVERLKRREMAEKKSSLPIAWVPLDKKKLYKSTDEVSNECPHLSLKIIPFGVWCMDCAQIIERIDNLKDLFAFSDMVIAAKEAENGEIEGVNDNE